jgi:hypothetical protein
MIDVIVTVRDAVFVAMMAWTGIEDDAAAPWASARDRDHDRTRQPPIEKQVGRPVISWT